MPQVSITGFGITHPTYKCIGPVRALSLKQDDPESYAKLTSLASKSDLSTEEVDLQEFKEIARFMRRFFDKLGDCYTDDEIVRAAGILQVYFCSLYFFSSQLTVLQADSFFYIIKLLVL